MKQIEHLPLPETVKIENLHKMAGYIQTVSQKVFDMSDCWNACNSVGCAWGHSYLHFTGQKNFHGGLANRWIDKFTGLNVLRTKIDERAFGWCFWAMWRDCDNTPKGAAKRIRYLLKYGLPKEFEDPSQKWVELYMNADLSTQPIGKEVIKDMLNRITSENKHFKETVERVGG